MHMSHVRHVRVCVKLAHLVGRHLRRGRLHCRVDLAELHAARGDHQHGHLAVPIREGRPPASAYRLLLRRAATLLCSKAAAVGHHSLASATARAMRAVSCSSISTPRLMRLLRALPAHVSRKRGT